LFKAPNETNIAEIIHIASYFPRFVDEDENRLLMEEVTEDELKVVLHSFQKSKIPGPDGWTIEFFWISLIFLERIYCGCRRNS
jgi:hypothetical protein